MLATLLPLKNDFVCRVAITTTGINPTTGELETSDVIGATDVSAFLSASSVMHTATPIHATLSEEMSGISGTNVYSAVFAGAALTTHLAALVGQKVYLHIVRGAANYHVVHGLTVTDEREATEG